MDDLHGIGFVIAKWRADIDRCCFTDTQAVWCCIFVNFVS